MSSGLVERTLAVRAGALGDTILALPALEALSARTERLEVLGTMPYVELTLGVAHAVHSMDRGWLRGLFEADADDSELVSFLRGIDLVVAWARLPLLAEKARLLGIRVIESSAHPPEGVHASDHLTEALAPLGIRGPAPLPRLALDAPPPELDMAPKSFVAIHPSSGSPRKNWPAERFLELARLARGHGLDILWVQGEADEEVVAGVRREAPAPVADKLPLRVLAAVLARSAVFVGNDSGVSHLSAAAGAPTLALFGATDARQWAPRGRRVGVGSTGASAEQVWGFARELMEPR